MKLFWFDSETTGLNHYKNDIISLAGLIEINGEIKDKIYLEIQPVNWENISDEALKVNGFTKDQLKTFLPQKEAHKKLNNFLGNYCNKFDRSDKLIIAGHNIIKFDIPFLEEFYKKASDKYMRSWFDYHSLDTVACAMERKIFGRLNTSNIKLETLANHFGVKINAHNALSNIEATREVFYLMAKT